MTDMLHLHGYRYSASIEGTPVEGIITVEGSSVYLCQNKKNGASCSNKHGYRHSWSVSGGTEEQLRRNNVKDLKIALEPFAIGQRVRIKPELTSYFYGGYGVLKSTAGSITEVHSDYLEFKTDCGKSYTMKFYEMEHLPSEASKPEPVPCVRKFEPRDNINYRGTSYYITAVYPDHIRGVRENGDSINIDKSDFDEIHFKFHDDWVPLDLTPGSYIEVVELRLYCTMGEHSPSTDNVPNGALVEVLEIGHIQGIDRSEPDIYIGFVGRYKHKTYAFCQCRENKFKIVSDLRCVSEGIDYSEVLPLHDEEVSLDFAELRPSAFYEEDDSGDLEFKSIKKFVL